MKQCVGFTFENKHTQCEVLGEQEESAFYPKYRFCKQCFNKKRNLVNKARRVKGKPPKLVGYRQCPVCKDFGIGPKPESDFFKTRSQCRLHIVHPELIELEHESPPVSPGMKWCIQCRRMKSAQSFLNKNPYSQTYCRLCDSRIPPVQMVEDGLFIDVYTYIADDGSTQIGGEKHANRDYQIDSQNLLINHDEYEKLWPNIFRWVGYDPNNKLVQNAIDDCRRAGYPDAKWFESWSNHKSKFQTIVGRATK